MKRKSLSVVLLLIVLVFFASLCACSKIDDALSLAIEVDDIESAYVKIYSKCIISWPYDSSIAHYKVDVYPTGDTTKLVYSTKITPDPTTIKVTCELFEEVVSWQYIDIYITGYNEDYTISTQTLKKSIVCSVEEEDLYIAEEQIPGVIDGYEESEEFYYAELSDNINVVKSSTNKNYAILVSDVSKVDSVTLPLDVENAYYLDEELNAIIFSKDFINAYSLGAVIPFSINYIDETKKSITISLVSVLTPAIKPISFNRGGANDMIIECLSQSSTWTYAQVMIDNKKASYAVVDKAIKMTASTLNKLSLGDHNLKIYYKHNNVLIGFSETTITVDKGGMAAYNVKVDIDNSYPAVNVSWDADNTYALAYVVINDTTIFASDTHTALFSGNSFTIQNYIRYTSDKVVIKLQYADGTIYSSDEASLDINLSDAISHAEFFTDSVSYLGENCNRYITSVDELNDYVAYSIIHYPDSDSFRETECTLVKDYTIYSPYLAQKYSDKALETVINSALELFIEPVSCKVETCTIANDIVTYSLALKSGSARPYDSYHAYAKTAKYIEYPYSELHFYQDGESQRSSTYDGFKVNDIIKTATVSTSLELALALEKRLKPDCVPGSAAEAIYLRAKEVLREIIDDRMSDYEKVLAIYDWISYTTVYDRGLTSLSESLSKTSSQYLSLYKNSSFYAEGVFLYQVAVCNGLGSAFSIMANIEGIPAYKTMGKVKSGSHTWVKVFVNDEWYICDPTWSSAVDTSNSSQYYEYMTYDFFMLSDDEAGAYQGRTEFAGKESYQAYAGNTIFDYYNSYAYVYNGKVYTRYVDEYGEFEALMDMYTLLDEKAMVKSGETIQFSIRGQKINSSTSSAARVFNKWLTEVYYPAHIGVQINFEITILERTESGLTDASLTTYLPIEYYNATAFIRIRAL